MSWHSLGKGYWLGREQKMAVREAPHAGFHWFLPCLDVPSKSSLCGKTRNISFLKQVPSSHRKPLMRGCLNSKAITGLAPKSSPKSLPLLSLPNSATQTSTSLLFFQEATSLSCQQNPGKPRSKESVWEPIPTPHPKNRGRRLQLGQDHSVGMHNSHGRKNAGGRGSHRLQAGHVYCLHNKTASPRGLGEILQEHKKDKFSLPKEMGMRSPCREKARNTKLHHGKIQSFKAATASFLVLKIQWVMLSPYQ